jgi:adenylosuccinate synthase
MQDEDEEKENAKTKYYKMKTGKVDVLLGLQWGDEGKGKVVDVLTPNYDVVARFQGGPNAGHTLEFEGQKYVLRSIPSGIFQGGKVNIIGNGVVLAPDLFMEEAEDLEKSGHPLKERLHISKKAHLIMPTHRILDRAYEAAKGKNKVGTTGKGIGPTYTDKVSRNGLRVGDILENFEEKYAQHKERHMKMLKALGWTDFEGFDEVEKKWLKGVDYLRQFPIVDSEHEVNNLLRAGKNILCEGAQGTMLDVDFGSYPFVTSSNTICAGACTGLGVGPNKVGNVYGIMKAYCTRVGAGPFPTELFDETGKTIRAIGHEYGAVTGRERRCGWIDLIQLRYSIMVNGVTELIMMKSDVLDGFDTIKACVGYELKDGTMTTELPYSIDDVKPVYKEMKGWKTDMTKFTSEDQFPQAFKDYIKFLEDFLETPIGIISIGPDREQTIVRKK